ncbi:MAG: hypothetical protein II886_14305 [Prevotella sp.]|nr:hypothetical protein [Prevotella sp.]
MKNDFPLPDGPSTNLLRFVVTHFFFREQAHRYLKGIVRLFVQVILTRGKALPAMIVPK